MYHRLSLVLFVACGSVNFAQAQRRVGKLQEVFAWKQLTFDIDGVILTQDRDEPVGGRAKRADRWEWSGGGSSSNAGGSETVNSTPGSSSGSTESDQNRFFIQYNNVPMGTERVGNRIFVTIPRRRYGIPSTLNYIEYDGSPTTRSPHLKPYPNIREAAELTSVYRTRADSCGRLWMVDTGRLELPVRQRQLRTPAIVIYDLNTNKRILRYELKSSDLPAENTPTGLASITVDITNDCADAYAYLPDLTTFGMVVYSLKENDSWRHQHNYYSFNPIAGNLFIANERFQWSDGVFSVTLLPGSEGCKSAYFHPLIGTHEFSVSTCVLKNKTISAERHYHSLYSVIGDRGEMTQSTMHDYHPGTNVIFYAEIGRDAVTCWNAGKVLRSSNVGVLGRHPQRLSYPAGNITMNIQKLFINH
ncbi:hypothetical protein ACJJTC_018282, partial [Scirpophaga incertulas]